MPKHFLKVAFTLKFTKDKKFRKFPERFIFYVFFKDLSLIFG